MSTRNQTKIKTVLTLAALAMAIVVTSANAAGFVVYQDNYDNDGIGTNAGIGGGAVSINTSPASIEWADGWWVDDGNLTMGGSGSWGGISGGSYSSNAFDLSGGFTLEVTYNALNSGDRFTMGLMEEAGTLDRDPTGTQPWPIGYLATSGTSAFEGIYFNAFAYDSKDRYPNAPGLQLADGSAVIQLSDAQSRDTGVHTLVLEMDADSNWSYSIDGAPATTGTITGGFDLSKSYSFITRNQPRRASQIIAVTLTSAESPGPTNISPEDGVTLDIGNVDLLWVNMDPNNPADPVFVDVWFGTDPDPKNGTKVVDAEPNRTSVTVSAPTEGTYYWQVGNYIHGSATGDPCEGDVWSFNAVADMPPSSVDAGIDMVTWSGQGVPLDATVVDDGKSPLTYAWSANPGEGVVFDPNATVEDPTVTITKATLDPSTVTLTLAVHDESYDPTPVEDTVTIDVYEDACLAAIGKGLVEYGPADFDENCITDLRDYAILAAKWLDDYALTIPVPK